MPRSENNLGGARFIPPLKRRGFSAPAPQTVLKNPLASPFTLGISSAAGFGATLAIIMGAGFAGGENLIVGNAFVFTFISSMIVLDWQSTREFLQRR